MSFCKKVGKDTIIFVTKEDHETPSSIVLPPSEPPAGLILDNGDINWNCPCLGGMATGPCGVEFRSAFSCFHYSENEPKGAECLESFQTMQECMKKFPSLYKQSDSDDGDDNEGAKMMPPQPPPSEKEPIDEPPPAPPRSEHSLTLEPNIDIPESSNAQPEIPINKFEEKYVPKPPTHGPQLIIENED